MLKYSCKVKGVVIMERKPFSTSIEVNKLAAFKEKCKVDRIDYNEAFETFIDLYLSNQIEFRRSVVVNINK
nr:MAG TPA: hypothetical protein [Caudoviricetes sp.]